MSNSLLEASCRFKNLNKLKPEARAVMLDAKGSLQEYLNKALTKALNSKLMGVCAGLQDNGFTSTQAVEVIYAMDSHREPINGEIERAVGKVYSTAVDAEITPSAFPQPKAREPHEVLSNIARLGITPLSEDELIEHLGESPEEADNATDFLQHYFAGLDNPPVYIGTKKHGQIQHLSTWLADGEIIDALGYDQMLANPMRRLLTEQERASIPSGGRRIEFASETLDVVTFESDSLPLELQLGVILYLSSFLPLVSIIYSGGKSYHATFSLEGLAPDQAHKVRHALADVGADTGVLSPYQLVRLGGVNRSDKGNKLQEVLWIDPNARTEPVSVGKLNELLGNVPDVEEQEEQPMRSISLIYPVELDMDELEDDDLVEGFIGQKVLACIYAPPASIKTFVALDMGAHIATGENWHGRDVQQGAVLYIGLEGMVGVKRRLKALKKEGIIDNDTPLVASPSNINLLSADSILQWIKLMQDEFLNKGVELKLVIVDTLLRAMAGGNINGSEDMSVAVEHGNTIIDEVGCSVLLVHHCGKDLSKGEMGSTALRAGVDSSIFVKRDGDVATVQASKQKDMADGSEMDLHFSLKVVEVGITVSGKMLTSCTIVKADKPAGGKDNDKMVKMDEAKRDMEDVLNVKGELNTTDWQAACKQTKNIPTRLFNDCRTELLECGRVNVRNEGTTYYWKLA